MSANLDATRAARPGTAEPQGPSQASLSIDLLAQAESRLLRLVASRADETTVQELAHILRDLSGIRMRIESLEGQGRRTNARVQEPAVALMEDESGGLIEIALHDVSVGGCLIEAEEPPQDGARVRLRLPGCDSVAGTAKSTRDGVTHVAFEAMSTPALMDLLKYLERRYQRY